MSYRSVIVKKWLRGSEIWAQRWKRTTLTYCDSVPFVPVREPFKWIRLLANVTSRVTVLDKAEMANRKRDVSLTVHFLFQCHMGFAPPLSETRSSLESIHSYGRNERDHRLWPIFLPHHHQGTYRTHFSQDTYLLNILTQNVIFQTHKSGEK